MMPSLVVMVLKNTRDLDRCNDMWGLPLVQNSTLRGWKVVGPFLTIMLSIYRLLGSDTECLVA